MPPLQGPGPWSSFARMLTDAANGRGGRALPMLLLLGLLLAGLGGGCSPDAFLVADEDRDRNLQRARDAERLGDFAMAAEHYERALDKNPGTPAVHLGYAKLSEARLKRYADAVYHYQRYLRLRPQDPKADDIRHRITNCTERLATTVPLIIRSETIARDLESVRSENQVLRSQLTNLLATTAYWSNEVRRLTPLPSLPSASLGGATGATNPPSGAGSGVSSGSSRSQPAGSRYGASATARSVTPLPPAPRPSTAAPPGTFRYHRVVAGETMESIARRYGITGATLQRANPRVDPRRMKAGTDLRIPVR